MRGFVRLRLKMFQASYQFAGPALRVNAVTVAAGSHVWRYQAGEWKRAEQWKPFERVGDDEFALFV
jgi:hypothetical protein